MEAARPCSLPQTVHRQRAYEALSPPPPITYLRLILNYPRTSFRACLPPSLPLSQPTNQPSLPPSLTSLSFGTTVGRHCDSWRGAQKAMDPSSCTLPCFVRHCFSWRP